MGPGGEGWGPAFLFVSLYKNLHPDPASHAAGRVGGGRRPAAHAAPIGSLCGLRTRTRRGGDDGGARGAWRLDGGARRVETIAPSSPPPVLLGRRLPHRLAKRRRFLLLPSPSGGVEDAGGIEPACADAPDGAPPPWGTQRRTRHRRMTTVSSTSGGLHRRRRRRRLLRGRHKGSRRGCNGDGGALASAGQLDYHR